ncbi:MAG: radical SAM protein [Parcubacteria group bacterium]
MGKLNLVLIHPVEFDCNIACGYCYNGSSRTLRDKPSRLISMETLELLFAGMAKVAGGNFTVIWHGGEPLLAGKEFYRSAIEAQRRVVGNRCKVRHCVQTNGTLIDSEWVDLFEKYDVAPSFSMDGPKDLHDAVRVRPDGTGTYDDVLRGYNLSRNRGIRTGLMVVVSSVNVSYPERMWEWILKQGITSLDFMPCFEPELVCAGRPRFSVTEDDMTRFLVRSFDLWFDHGDPNIRIRTFRETIKGMIGARNGVCSWNGSCLNNISIAQDGRVFPCSRYHSYPEMTYGTLGPNTLEELMTSPSTISTREGIARAQDQCPDCRWFPICHSGCPFLRYAIAGTWDAPYVHCSSRQALFAHIEKRITSHVSGVR